MARLPPVPPRAPGPRHLDAPTRLADRVVYYIDAAMNYCDMASLYRQAPVMPKVARVNAGLCQNNTTIAVAAGTIDNGRTSQADLQAGLTDVQRELLNLLGSRADDEHNGG